MPEPVVALRLLVMLQELARPVQLLALPTDEVPIFKWSAPLEAAGLHGRVFWRLLVGEPLAGRHGWKEDPVKQ